MKKLSIIIVNYNVKHYLEQCLNALMKALSNIDAEVFVVDNHSSDDSVQYLTPRFPSVSFISSKHNLGFSRGNNLAIEKSSGEYVLLLNPDTIVTEDSIADVLQFMDKHTKTGGVGVRMLKSDGTYALESRRGLPTPLTAFYKMSGLCAKYPTHKKFGKYYMGYLSWDKPEQIEVMSGAFCMLRRSALDKVGLLDQDFFMYGEDIDLSYRLLKGGYENWYYPTDILHYKGESTQKTSFKYVHVFYEAMLIFFKKHYGGSSFFFSFPIKVAIYSKAFIALMGMQVHNIKKSLGLLRIKPRKQDLYIIIGEKEMIEKCSAKAQQYGLEIQTVEGNEQSLPDGHAHLSLPNNQTIYVVYDVNAYSYQHILDLFKQHSAENISLGTYDKRSDVIITQEDVFV